jgi:hypothetical protein
LNGRTSKPRRFQRANRQQILIHRIIGDEGLQGAVAGKRQKDNQRIRALVFDGVQNPEDGATPSCGSNFYFAPDGAAERLPVAERRAVRDVGVGDFGGAEFARLRVRPHEDAGHRAFAE